MPVSVEFRWRAEPALVFVSFQSPANVRLDVAAVVAPLFPFSWISGQLASDLERFGCVTAAAAGSLVEASVTVQGVLVGPLQLSRRLRALPVRLEPGTRAELMLGLDFLSLFRECRLTFSGPVARLTMQTSPATRSRTPQ